MPIALTLLIVHDKKKSIFVKLGSSAQFALYKH